MARGPQPAAMIESPVLAELGRLFSRLDPDWDQHCAAILSDLVQANQQGHVCLPLSQHGSRQRLSRSPLVGGPGQYAPLILDPQHGLYFARHWFDETRLARQLLLRAASGAIPDAARVRPWLERLFPASAADGPDLQKQAAALAVRQPFLVISGGPGTGKTTTVVRLLALLAALSARPLVMALAAPTGKAAARLSESMRAAADRLPVAAEIRQQLPGTAQTLHRLLGLRPGVAEPRFHAANPLPLDLLVVDEASMIDLGLMAQMVDALPRHARLIMLGDRDQLASVDAGAVLAELCQHVVYRRSTMHWLAELDCAAADAPSCADQQGGLADCVALLTRSHRFSADSGIGALSRLVNGNQPAAARELLQSGRYADLAHQAQLDAEDLYLQRTSYWQALRAQAGADTLQQAFATFMPLVSERRQVSELNRMIEDRLERDGLKPREQSWYHGRPVMIATNDYGLGLFNGDIGFALQQADGLRVLFPAEDGSWRAFAPGRLPEHETVYAMTVHKSQGSEFERVWLLMPRAGAALPERALVYTAITRARRHFTLCGGCDTLEAAIAHAPQRFSGLAQRMRVGVS